MPRLRSKTWTLREKLSIVEEGLVAGIKPTCKKHQGLFPSQLRRWIKQKEELKNATFKYKKTLHKGKPPKFPHLEEKLLQWVQETRKKGIGVNYRTLLLQIKTLESTFKDGDNHKILKWINKFCCRHKYVNRKRSHVAQRLPEEETQSILSFHRYLYDIRKKNTYLLACIGNMDQVPIYFDMPGERTLEKQGTKGIIVKTNGGEKLRITVALTCLANGEKLPPYVIFRGKPEGRIAKKELQALEENEYPTDLCYNVQQNSWMNEGSEITIKKNLR